MRELVPILSITGSDCTGNSGIQADVKTISALGCQALTVVTAVTSQDGCEISDILDVPQGMIIKQTRTLIEQYHPCAIKIGLIREAQTIKPLRDEIIGCSKIVFSPGIISSSGQRMVDDETIRRMMRFFLPEAKLLMLRCDEAELFLHRDIITDDDYISAAKELTEQGAEYVLLRGRLTATERLKALLYGQGELKFFSSYNIDGWHKHGVGGALSSAIATRMGMGDNVPLAICNAHDYIHSQVVYSVEQEDGGPRIADLYNQFVSLIMGHYTMAHDVAFYADKLSITPRYLSHVTAKAVSKSPKQVIADYLLQQAKSMLDNSRLSVQEISIALGFSSQALFCNFFKIQEGRTPSEYRGL